MTLLFDYDREKDIWCVLTYGKGAQNTSHITTQYEALLKETAGNPTPENTSQFIDSYLANSNIGIQTYIKKYKDDWETVSLEYRQIAERIFNTSLPRPITAYLTINSRRPYNLKEDYFFLTVPSQSMRRPILHELWHFYTWHAFGKNQKETLGEEKYNMLNEALTVLLNVECNELLPDGILDNGYPQHKKLREKITIFWNRGKNIKELWAYMIENTP
jgi:hypothetical protein